MVMVEVLERTTEEDIEIQWILIEQLDPHPINSQIYGENEGIDSLTDSIIKNGLQEPFTVTRKDDRFEIIHGHRRRIACIKAGMKSVPCILKNFPTREDAIAALLSGNEYRDKSIEQKSREYLAWLDLEKERAKNRQGKPGEGQGAVRDILAKRVGLGSGVNAEHAITALKVLDETADAPEGTARHQQHQQLKQLLSRPRGVDAAYKLVKPPEKPQPPTRNKWIPKEGDRIHILSGPHKGKDATITVALNSLCGICHIDGNPEHKRDQIPYNKCELISEQVEEKKPTSIHQEISQQQQDLGLGRGKQILPTIERNQGEKTVEPLQASATNLNVVGDALVGEMAVALLKLSPKQLGEVMRQVEPELSVPQLEAIWKALSDRLAHKAA